jgi:hypothetical protein
VWVWGQSLSYLLHDLGEVAPLCLQLCLQIAVSLFSPPFLVLFVALRSLGFRSLRNRKHTRVVTAMYGVKNRC